MRRRIFWICFPMRAPISICFSPSFPLFILPYCTSGKLWSFLTKFSNSQGHDSLSNTSSQTAATIFSKRDHSFAWKKISRISFFHPRRNISNCFRWISRNFSGRWGMRRLCPCCVNVLNPKHRLDRRSTARSWTISDSMSSWEECRSPFSPIRTEKTSGHPMRQNAASSVFTAMISPNLPQVMRRKFTPYSTAYPDSSQRKKKNMPWHPSIKTLVFAPMKIPSSG